jgi:hypothetical protein
LWKQAVQTELFTLVEELRALGTRRADWSRQDAARHRTLFAEVSRRSARVPRPMAVSFSGRGESAVGVALDFGMNGLYLSSDFVFEIGEEVTFERAMIGSESLPLFTSARAVWRPDPPRAGGGLEFSPRSLKERSQIERIFYRLLHLHLGLNP